MKIKKSTPSVIVNLKKDGETVHSTKSSSRLRISRFVQGKDFDKGHIRVIYNGKLDYTNESEFTNANELTTLLNVFLEKELIDEFNGATL